MKKELPSSAIQRPLAGFEKRLYAIAIDMILIIFVAILLGIYQNSLLLIVLQIIYFSLCWSRFAGQTVGNKLMHIRVVSLSEKPLTLQQSLLRYVGFFLSEIVFFLGFLWIFWDKKRQGWHDKLAKTIVIKV
jgi:uncharacterized RDD family membrane protein YckC